MMSKEAIAHYEAALKEAFPRGATGEVFHHWNEARYLIATEALDRMAENARELGLDYEPAQQEPVECANGCRGFVKHSPPAQRTWVGLTDEEIEKLNCVYPLWDDGESCTIMGIKDFARAIETAHGIKENT